MSRELYHESHFCAMEKQGSVYTMAPVSSNGNVAKVLYSSNISDKLMTLKFDYSEHKLSPISSPLVSVYPLSNGSSNFLDTLVEVAALHVIDNCDDDGFTVGVVFKPHLEETVPSSGNVDASKAVLSRVGDGGSSATSGVPGGGGTNVGMSTAYRLHLYNCSNDGSYLEGPVEKPIGEVVALHLTHAYYIPQSPQQGKQYSYRQQPRLEPVFILAKSDLHGNQLVSSRRVHVCDLKTEDSNDKSRDDDFLFPEFRFSKFHGKIHWIESRVSYSRYQRLTAMCTDTGLVRLILVNLTDCSLVKQLEFEQDSPLTRVLLLDHHWPSKSYDQQMDWLHPDGPHLVVCSGLEPVVCYINPLKHGLSIDNQVILPQHCEWMYSADVEVLYQDPVELLDCVVTTCVTDVDMDGLPELVIGTFGKGLFCYKMIEDISDQSGDHVDLERPVHLRYKFELIYGRRFADPVLCVAAADMTGDGAEELLVLTSAGLHVLQRHRQDCLAVMENRMKELLKNLLKES